MKFTRHLAIAAALALLAGPLAAQERTLQLGHLANEDNSWHKASLKFAEEVKRLTDGRIEVQVFPNESLGKEIDLINGMQLGTVDMTITGESLQNWAPMAALLAVPYAYKSLEQMDEVASGEVGDEIEAQIVERAQVRPLAYFARGPRELTSNREIKTPEDLNGLKMRVPNVPLFVNVWSALGAQPTPMAFSEVFTSLQNGTIDAQENPLALIRSASFAEVQKFVNLTDHVRSWIYLAISEQTWSQLSDEDKAAIQEAADTAQGLRARAVPRKPRCRPQGARGGGHDLRGGRQRRLRGRRARCRAVQRGRGHPSDGREALRRAVRRPVIRPRRHPFVGGGFPIPRSASMRFVETLQTVVVALFRALLGISFLVLIGSVLLQVAGRFGGSSPVWTEELSRFALLYLAAIGAGLALQTGELVNVAVLSESLPERASWTLRLVSAVAVAGLGLYLLPMAWKFTSIGAFQTSPALGLTMTWVHVTMLLLPGLLAFFALLRIAGMLAGTTDGRPHPLADDVGE